MFTPSQTRAIETPTRDILVSAGAGSGKTTVLTERIMQKLLKGYRLEDFLVVTFTKASAADLRKKLGKRLEELSIKHPRETRYQKLLYALPVADIGTIDSFCLQYVKENATALGLYKGVAVGDEALCDALLTATADNLITELCDEDDRGIDLLLDNFAGFKNDSGLISTLCNLYLSLRKYPFYKDWLDSVLVKEAAERAVLKEKGFFACARGKQVRAIIEKQLKTARGYIDAMHSLADTESEVTFAAEAEAALSTLERGLEEGYEGYCKGATEYKIRRRPNKTGAEYTAAYNAYKGIIDSRGDYVRSPEALMAEYDYTAKVLGALVRVAKRLDSDYAAAKADRGIIDFADAEQLFLSLLLENTAEGTVKTSLCRSIAASYKEVFIDEYQDVSPLQDAIFTAIGAGKRFMVGDLKQSIYGFREAYPDIFMGYRDSFAPEEENKENAVIYLTHNFRCDGGIIDFCNYLFDRIFTLESADTDYTRERLVMGKPHSDQDPVHLTVIENDEDDKEYDIVAEQIVGLIYEGFSPSDIAIIARETSSLKKAVTALEKRGIPNATEKTADVLLKQPEVLLAISLIKVIDNPNDDISLAALLRSPIFRFTAKELTEVRTYGSGASFYQNLKAAAEESTALGKKCALFMEKLGIYRAKALILPAHSLLWYLYEDTHLFAYAPEGGEERYRDNLYMLYELAGGMEAGVYKGVSVFAEYINRLQEDDRSPKAAVTAAENAVRLMTIHGSKGLEFPIVFVVGTGGKIKTPHHKASTAVNYRTGISVKLAKQKEGWRTSTLLRNADIAAKDSRNIAEEHRLLYVAFTRAEKRLYLSAALPCTVDEYLEKQRIEPSLLADLFLPTLLEGKDDSYTLSVLKGEDEVNTTILPSAMARSREMVVLPEIRNTPKLTERVTAKYAASAVKRTKDGTLTIDSGELITDRKPSFAGGSVNAGALKGTATHAFMQFADYGLAEKDVCGEADRLLSKGFISAEHRSLLDEKALRGFFDSSLYREIKASGRVYREKRFNMGLPAPMFGGSGEEVLVQGVIDCFFENADGSFTLVDYKTDYIKKGDEELLKERYGTQLYLYSLYVKKVTGKEVKAAYLYSLSLSKAIPCEIEKYGV